MPKNVQTIAQLHSFHTLKAVLKILQAWLQQYVNQELPNVQAGSRKGRGTRNQMPTSVGSLEETREFQKNISALLTEPKPLTAWMTTNCGKFFKKWD